MGSAGNVRHEGFFCPESGLNGYVPFDKQNRYAFNNGFIMRVKTSTSIVAVFTEACVLFCVAWYFTDMCLQEFVVAGNRFCCDPCAKTLTDYLMSSLCHCANSTKI